MDMADVMFRERVMKVIFIGGSNTFMTGGYVTQTLKAMKTPVTRLENLAVGGSPCVLGFDLLLDYPDLGDFDLYVIEYMINDYTLIKRRPGGEETWYAAYEGMIRHILTQNPRARIVSILFGRRDDACVPAQEILRKGIRKLSKHYGLSVIDIDGQFRTQYEGNSAGFQALYRDSAHYCRPDITQIIAKKVAGHLDRMMESEPIVQPLLPPFRPGCFDSLKTVNLPALDMPGLERGHFENSRFSLDTLILRPGHDLELTLGGDLVSLSYITTANGCALSLIEDDRETMIDTVHERVANGEFEFIVRGFPMVRKSWTAGKESVKVVLKALTLEEREERMGSYQKMYNMIAPKNTGADSTIHLLKTVYLD